MKFITVFTFLLIFLISDYVSASVDNKDSVQISFTEEEKVWIKKHPIINVGGETDLAPFDFVTENGKYNGIANDYLKEIEKISGLEFKIHTGQIWSELLDDLKIKKTRGC